MLTISDSIDAILNSPGSFGQRFYSMLFANYPDLEQHFEGVNMPEQAVVVTMALKVIEQYYTDPNPATYQYLQLLGSRHRRRQIGKELYADWLLALLDTLSAFHEHSWHEGLAQQWTEAIETATRVMFEGYDSPTRV